MSDKPRWAPTISLARRIGQELGADCMILVRSEGGQWGGASWGRTRDRCASLGRVMDGLFDDGRLDGMINEEPETARHPHPAAPVASGGVEVRGVVDSCHRRAPNGDPGYWRMVVEDDATLPAAFADGRRVVIRIADPTEGG